MDVRQVALAVERERVCRVWRVDLAGQTVEIASLIIRGATQSPILYTAWMPASVSASGAPTSSR
jgi:hypothetical protein